MFNCILGKTHTQCDEMWSRVLRLTTQCEQEESVIAPCHCTVFTSQLKLAAYSRHIIHNVAGEKSKTKARSCKNNRDRPFVRPFILPRTPDDSNNARWQNECSKLHVSSRAQSRDEHDMPSI